MDDADRAAEYQARLNAEGVRNPPILPQSLTSPECEELHDRPAYRICSECVERLNK